MSASSGVLRASPASEAAKAHTFLGLWHLLNLYSQTSRGSAAPALVLASV